MAYKNIREHVSYAIHLFNTYFGCYIIHLWYHANQICYLAIQLVISLVHFMETIYQCQMYQNI